MRHISFWSMLMELICWGNINIIHKKSILTYDSEEVDLEVNTENTKLCVDVTRMQDKFLIQ
jgi:hypothetical protein